MTYTTLDGLRIIKQGNATRIFKAPKDKTGNVLFYTMEQKRSTK